MLFKDTNQIKRNYYLNLFSENAEIVKYKNNNHIYNWNIRDLQLGSYAEMALVNINSINDDLTAERQYPPKAYNSFTNEITSTAELLNILPTTYYKQTITLNTDNITYGSGNYIIYSSSTWDGLNYFKDLLFNYNNEEIGSAWKKFEYDITGGYIKNNYIVSNYLGDWIIIKLPTPIVLTKYIFYNRLTFEIRAPGEWKCYGSNDGVNFIEITEASQLTRITTSSYVNGFYTKSFNNSIPYLYIGFTINKLAGNNDVLNLAEIQLFGSEKIVRVKQRFSEEREYPPKLYNSSTAPITSTGEIVNTNPSTYYKETFTLNTTGITYGSGTYDIYYSSSYNFPNSSIIGFFNKNYADSVSTGVNNFNIYTGYYNYPSVSNYIVNNFLGDWIVLKLPTPILLTKFRFYNRPFLALRDRAPSLWYCHGSNDGINWVEIKEASNNSVPAALTINDYSKEYYEKVLNTNSTTTYRYIGFTINKLVGLYTTLNISEIQLFGKEEIFLLTDERQYPPKAYNSFTNEITGTGEILNVNPLNYIKETITLNTDNINYGDGTYIIYSSATTNDVTRTRAKIFNFTYVSSSGDVGGYWGFNGYNMVTGYQINNRYIKSNYFGEWSIIKFPFSFILTKYIIYVDIFLPERWPSLWRFYGSNDGINWTDIIEAEVSTPLIATDFISNKYEKSININTPYKYIGITFNKVIGNSSSSGTNHLAIQEIQFFGKQIEEEEQTYIIRCSNCYEDGYDSQNNSSAILFMNNRLKTIKNPTYHKIKSYNLNRISLQVSNEIEETDIFKGWDDTIKFGTVFHIKNYKD